MARFAEKKKGGGEIKGKPHSQGGEHFVVPETGQHIEAEDKELVASGDSLNSPECQKDKTYTGTTKKIITDINKVSGGKSANDKATELHAGDYVINKKSSQDNTQKTVTGTCDKVVKTLNNEKQSGSVMEDGGEINKYNNDIDIVKIHIPFPFKNIKEKIKNKILYILKQNYIDIESKKISINDFENINKYDDYFLIPTGKYFLFNFFKRPEKSNLIDEYNLYYSKKIKHILDNPNLLYDFFDIKIELLNARIDTDSGLLKRVISNVMELVLKDYFDSLIPHPHSSIIKGKPENEIAIINNLWLAWELNSVTPHGYKSNSEYRSILFDKKNEYIKKAIGLLSEKSNNIEINISQKDGFIIYFTIDLKYQISFHGSYGCVDEYKEKCKNEYREWLGFKTKINPLSIGKNKIKDFNNYKNYAKYLNEKYNLNIDENLCKTIIYPDVISKNIDIKLNELKNKYNIPSEIKYSLGKPYFGYYGLYFSINGKNLLDNKKDSDEDVVKIIFSISPDLITYYLTPIYYINEKTLKSSILKAFELSSKYYSDLSDSYKNDSLQYKTKTSKKRLELEKESEHYKLKSEQILSDIDVFYPKIINKYYEISELNKLKEKINSANNELHDYFANKEFLNKESDNKVEIKNNDKSSGQSMKGGGSVGDVNPDLVIKHGEGKGKTIKDIAKKYNVSIEQVAKAVAQGMKFEKEHGDNPEMQQQVSMNHIWELGLLYYDKDKGLPAMEDKLKQENQIIPYAKRNDVWMLRKSKNKYNFADDLFSRNKLLYNDYIVWYRNIRKDIEFSITLPNEFNNEIGISVSDAVIIDVYEKINQDIDAKKYMNEFLEIADIYGVDVYLSPEPRYNRIMQNESKKAKITKEYLIEYYKKFGFRLVTENQNIPAMEEKLKQEGEDNNTEFLDSIKVVNYIYPTAKENIKKKKYTNAIYYYIVDDRGIILSDEFKTKKEAWIDAKNKINIHGNEIRKMKGEKIIEYDHEYITNNFQDLETEEKQIPAEVLADYPDLKEELNYKLTTPEHAKEYGITAVKPLWLQRLWVEDSCRRKGVGTELLNEIEAYAKENGCDVIFGQIEQKSDYTAKEPNYLNSVQCIKGWLHERGYAVNNDTNDFHKVLKQGFEIWQKTDSGFEVVKQSSEQGAEIIKTMANDFGIDMSKPEDNNCTKPCMVVNGVKYKIREPLFSVLLGFNHDIKAVESGFMLLSNGLALFVFNENPVHNTDYKKAVNLELIIEQLKKDGLFEKYGKIIVDAYLNGAGFEKYDHVKASDYIYERKDNEPVYQYLFSQNSLVSSRFYHYYYPINSNGQSPDMIIKLPVSRPEIENIVKKADKEGKKIVAQVEDEDIEYYQSLGFKIVE